MAEHFFDLVRLLDHDADTHRVNRRLNAALLPLTAADGNGVQDELLARAEFEPSTEVPRAQEKHEGV